MQKKLDLPTQEELYQFFNGNPDRTVFVGQIYDIENVNFEDVHILPKLLTKGIKVIVELTQMSAKGNFDYQKLFTTISHY